MTEPLETMLVSVRADTGGFARDVAAMKAELEGPLAAGMDRAGRALEGSLQRFIQTGKFGFEDLKKVALSVMAEIARASVAGGLASLGGGGNALSGGSAGSGSGGGAASLLTTALQIATAFIGAPGRATGGPVSPGRAYMVGERGPELFVPTTSGRVDTGAPGSASRSVTITVNVHGSGNAGPGQMQATGRQIARQVRAAVIDAE